MLADNTIIKLLAILGIGCAIIMHQLYYKTCKNYPCKKQYLLEGMKNDYLVGMNVTPTNKELCANFFNEYWVCAATDEQYSMMLQSGRFDDKNYVSTELNSEISIEYVPGPPIIMEPGQQISYNPHVGMDSASSVKCQSNAEWYLQQITDANANVYPFEFPQKPTTVYVLDTMIDITHPEFSHRRTTLGPIFSDDKKVRPEKNGHGTHVASLINGNSYGVNKQANVIGLTVLGNDGRTSYANLVKALEYVAKQKTGIINMSIAGGVSRIIDSVVEKLSSRGFRVVVAAGNSAADACQFSPARSSHAVTVGALTKAQKIANFSNLGRCVDIYAPGQDILAAFPQHKLALMSGTSMAAPIVAGAWSTMPQLEQKCFLSTFKVRLGLINVDKLLIKLPDYKC